MFMCNIYPRQTFHPLFLGSIIEATGISVLAYALHIGHIPTIYGMMGLTGCGTGLRFMPISLHGIGFFPNNITSVISMMSFAVPFGGTISMTLMGTVFNNKAGRHASSSSTSIQQIEALPPEMQGLVRDEARAGVVWAFVAIVPLMWLCVVAAGALGNVRITRRAVVDEKGNRDFSENVTDSVFLVGLLRRMGGKRKEKVETGQEVEVQTSIDNGNTV